MSIKAKWAIIVTGLLLMPAAAYTYTLLSPTRHWASVPVTVCVMPPGHASITANDPDGGVTATINALNGNAGMGWNGTLAGWVVNAVNAANNSATCGTEWRLGDGIPTIAFDEKIKGACSGSCLAATFVSYYECNNAFPDGHCKILDSDVLTRRNRADKSGGPYYSLYESSCTSGWEYNVEAIMVHEVGHVLGIGHSNVSGATMYPSVSSCNSSGATIEADDIAALDMLY